MSLGGLRKRRPGWLGNEGGGDRVKKGGVRGQAEARSLRAL